MQVIHHVPRAVPVLGACAMTNPSFFTLPTDLQQIVLIIFRGFRKVRPSSDGMNIQGMDYAH